METTNDINENKKPVSKRTGGILAEIISGRIFINKNIQKHVGYFIFVFFLAALYIGYRYKVESTALENKKLDSEIKELHTEYIYKLTELMKKGTKSEVLKKIKEMNQDTIQTRKITIKESQNPFTRIKTD